MKSETNGKNIKNTSTTKIIIFSLLILIILGCLVWFVFRYPSSAGWMEYKADLPQDLDLIKVEQILINHDYPCELENGTESYQIPTLRTTDSSNDNGITHIRIIIDDADETIYIKAYRDIYVPMYVIFQDLWQIEMEEQKNAEEDVIKVAKILDVPSNGTFWYRDEIDSLDYFIPTTAFYIWIAVYPLIICSLIIILVILNRESHRYPQMPSPHFKQKG